MKTRILVIDDDVALQRSLSVFLQDLGYEVEMAGKGIDGLRQAFDTKPDLVILDVMLPELDGWEICQRFREMTNIPILFLTALGSEDDVVKGLELGGDDYLVKPVSINVLEARVKALLRRATGRRRSSATISSVMQYQGLFIDLDTCEVKLNDQPLDFSPTEFNLLACLVRHQGRVLSNRFLLNQVWGPQYSGEDNLRLYISYLRHKIEVDPSKPTLIQTARGIGYRFG